MVSVLVSGTLSYSIGLILHFAWNETVEIGCRISRYRVNIFSVLTCDTLQDNLLRHKPEMDITFESSASPQHKKVFSMICCAVKVSYYTNEVKYWFQSFNLFAMNISLDIQKKNDLNVCIYLSCCRYQPDGTRLKHVGLQLMKLLCSIQLLRYL
ncbi:hypothetical protein ACSQ67_004565 [Phaseolus vulgaris]